MQISRHWRLNSLRYRLQGVRYENGTVSLQTRIVQQAMNEDRCKNSNSTNVETEKLPVAALA